MKYWFVVIVLIIANYGLATKCMANPQFPHSLKGTEQVVYVHSLQGSKGWLERWECNAQGQWLQVGIKTPVILGRNGAISAEQKREGDGCTPRGVYKLGMTFGYEDLMGVHMPYRVLTGEDFWVDEPQSTDYNTLVNGRPTSGSYEVMRRADRQYSLGAVIEYNTQPAVPYKGSAIFLHVWSSPNAATAGCIAMDKEQLRSLLLWLEPDKNPIIKIE